MKKAVVLLSGGLDSTTILYWAKKQGFRCYCLIFDYGQRHSREIESAKKIAQRTNCRWEIVKFNLPWKGSSLLDKRIALPKRTRTPVHQSIRAIPSTYVPARNTIFLSFAVSYAERIGAEAIFFGANQIDFSGYPDCRSEFISLFNKLVKSGTRSGVSGKRIKVFAPLINKTKGEIIRLGLRLNVPYELTWSCYWGGKKPCGKCDSCLFREKGFKEAGVKDPLLK